VESNIDQVVYIESKRLGEKDIELLLNKLGDNINFYDDVWPCNKSRKSKSQCKWQLSIHFSKTPAEYKTFAKYYVLLDSLQIATIRRKVSHMSKFFQFLENECGCMELSKVNKKIINDFEIYLNSLNLKYVTKQAIWGFTYRFFKVLNGFEGMPLGIPISRNNPWSNRKKDQKINTKYIPEHVTRQLDKLFTEEKLPLYYQLVYWLLRSIPSRVSEIVGMEIDCIKKYGDDYIIIIPTWKQNGGYREAQKRFIHVKEEGHGKFLLDLIRQQQKIAESYQHLLQSDKKGMLFTIRTALFTKGTNEHYVQYGEKHLTLLSPTLVGPLLKRLCIRYNIRDSDGKIYNISSHQFRHNGITDRLYEGFSVIQIRDMTGHQGEAMIMGSYKHVIPEKNKKIQLKTLVGETYASKNPVYFRGRILNLDRDTEKRLLENPRAYEITDGDKSLGICTDITSCKGGLFECLACDKFAPKVGQLAHFENEVKKWERKCVLFSNNKEALENAEYNLKLHRLIVSRIKEVMKSKGGPHEEKP